MDLVCHVLGFIVLVCNGTWSCAKRNDLCAYFSHNEKKPEQPNELDKLIVLLWLIENV